VPQIEVTFDIDANGIVSVTAKDKASSKEQSIRIEGSSGIDKDEIEHLVKDAEAHSSEDAQRRERIDVHNSLDSMVYEAGKMLAEHREKIPVSDLNAVESVIAGAKSLLEKEDAPTADLKSHMEQLQGALHKVSQALYQKETQESAADGASDGSPAQSGNGEGEVVDAEFTEEK
jgi:molecular chaperone DnaK